MFRVFATGEVSGALINVVAHVLGLAEARTILPQILNRWHCNNN